MVDRHERSGLNCLPTIIELARPIALEHGNVNVKVTNCHNRKFILELLVDCAEHGVSAQAYWQNGRQLTYTHVASIVAGARYPTYCVAPLRQSAIEPDRRALSLQPNTRVDLLGQLHEMVGGHTGYRQVAAEQFSHAHESALEGCVDISAELWQTLNKLPESVLVENSERSRSGAGGR
jgi:hypothetical protein